MTDADVTNPACIDSEQDLRALLTFFWVELGADDIVAPDDGGDVARVVAMRQPVGRSRDAEMIGMDEIGVLTGGDPVQHRMRPGRSGVDDQIVPAHMRHFQPLVRRHDPHHFAGDPAEAAGVAVFAAPGGQHLHADADAEERPRPQRHRFVDRLEQPGEAVERRPAGRKRPVAGQHDAVGAGHVFGARRDDDLARVPLSRHALKRFFGGMQIAAVEIDQNRQHRSALRLTRRPWSRAARPPCADRVRRPCARRGPPI